MKSSFVALSLVLWLAASIQAQNSPSKRSLVTDEPRRHVGKPDGAPDYVPQTRTTDGQHLALTVRKLREGFDPPRPFRIWGLGSSYTNMLGNGQAWQSEIPKRFPKGPSIQYQKMVGNSCPWQYVRGWARHLVVPDQPDLVVIYTLGRPEDLEKLIVEIRTQTTADIIVPSIHWRTGDEKVVGGIRRFAAAECASRPRRVPPVRRRVRRKSSRLGKLPARQQTADRVAAEGCGTPE